VKLRDQTKQAAHTILTQCLSLPTGAEIVVFGDETTIDAASILAEVAVNLELEPILTYFTTPMQMALEGKELAPALEAMLKEAEAALICLNDRPECLSFRDNVRQAAWNMGCKVAHMPGINPRILRLADADHQELSAQCEMLALALVKGRHIEIVSWDQQGNEHYLQTALDPWVRLPIVSDGLIQKGAWGNVPSGETYIAPPEGLAEGTIVINGSMPGYRMGPGEEIVLRFQGGHVVAWTPPHSLAARHLEQTQIAFARSRGDANWSNLAEIGLGANPRVRDLTGNLLLDEKKYGTAHIALGGNVDMGGEVQSRIHCAMVCLLPRVLVDGKAILDGGKIVMEARDWREDHEEINPPAAWHGELHIKCTATQTYVNGQGRLQRSWDTSAGRVCSVPVGSDRTAALAARVYQWMQERGQPVTIHELARQKRAHLSELLRLTYVLKLYGLVKAHDGEV
jgi:hypothetical protein